MVPVRYFNTVRYLRPVQIYGRVWKKLYRPKPDLRPPPPPRDLHGSWIKPIRKRASLLAPCKVRFLKEVGEISGAEDWNNASMTQLWLYNLHYFDDLSSRANPSRKVWQGDMINRWVSENPPGTGIGWEPYPLSLRIDQANM